jgi:hypothetical protein
MSTSETCQCCRDPLIIAQRELSHIKDIAQQKLRDGADAREIHKLMFESLADFLIRHGYKPQFKVHL